MANGQDVTSDLLKRTGEVGTALPEYYFTRQWRQDQWPNRPVGVQSLNAWNSPLTREHLHRLSLLSLLGVFYWPVRIAFMKSASVQLPRLVSGAGVRFLVKLTPHGPAHEVLVNTLCANVRPTRGSFSCRCWNLQPIQLPHAQSCIPPASSCHVLIGRGRRRCLPAATFRNSTKR